MRSDKLNVPECADRLRRLAAELMAEAERLEQAGQGANAGSYTEESLPEHDQNLVPKMAAHVARVSEDTITRWCATKGIGEKIGGRWRISERKLRAFIDERPV